jgi:hypothetical protein
LEWLEERVVPSSPQVINVGAGDTTGLINAILLGDSSQGGAIINLAAGSTYDVTQPFVSTQNGLNGFWFGPEGLPPITNTIVINGSGSTIQRDPKAAQNFRLFFISGGPSLEGNTPAMTAGSLTLNNLTLQNGVAHGGNANVGGGGLGAGGAIFNMGTLTLNGDTLTNNSAIGGSAGVTTITGLGGGGMGSDADNSGNGGGMGGPLSATTLTNLPQGGAGSTSNGAGGGGAGFSTNGAPAQAGGFGGAGGGSSGLATLSGDGGDGSFAFAGSGVGGNGGAFGSGGAPGVGGGGGGVGGGGGGATNDANGGDGGDGGFGGGGGGFGGRTGQSGSGNFAGYGGFGGGDGKNDSTALPAQHNFGGGNGGSTTNANITGGGGGAGMGGALFNLFGTVAVTNSTFSGNTATGGDAATGSQGGGAYGGGLFNLNGTVSLTYVTVANNSAKAGTSGAGGDASLADGYGVYNLADANAVSGAAATATLSLQNCIIGANNGTGGFDLGNNALNGNSTNTAHITGSTNLAPSGGAHEGNGTTVVDAGVFVSNFSQPKLGALQNNGGPTFTMALPPGTPGAGAADPALAGLPTVDQRGFARPSTQGQDDLGAFQNQNTNTVVTTTTGFFNGTSGTPVTIHATVTSSGAPVTEGTVAFSINGTSVGSATVNAQGQASVNPTLPPSFVPGTYTVKANYTDTSTPSIFGSSSGTATLTIVVGFSTQTTITSTSVSSTFNSTTAQSVTLTANVTSAQGGTVNEGNVTFSINGVSASGMVLNGTATATFNVPAGTLAGSYPITAIYADPTGTKFVPSTATNSGTLTITAASSQVSVGNVATTFNTGAQLVTLTATLTSPNGGTVNEGNVTFTLGSQTAIGSVSNGTAAATLLLPSGLAPGAYPLDAGYADTTNQNGVFDYGPSTAPTGSLTVNPAPTTVDVSNPNGAFNPSTTQQVTLTATVTSTGGVVSEGNVTFTVAGHTATVAVNAAGQASTTLTLPAGFAAGAYTISASYDDIPSSSGTVLFASGQGSGTLTVNAAATQTAITSPNLSVGFNSSKSTQETLSASVTTSLGAINEGVVTFSVGTLSVQGTVLNGMATATLTLPAGFAAGTYAIGATYSDTSNNHGAANYAASSATTPVTLTVGTASTGLAVSNGSATFSTASQSVTLQATLTSPTGGTVAEGSVTFSLGGLPAVSAAVNLKGVATATLVLPAGFAASTYSISASYADSANSNKMTNFAPSTNATATLTVGPAATQVSVANVSTSFNSSNPATLALTANVTSPGGTVTEGSVSFVVGGLTAKANVDLKGMATAQVTLPASFAAGAYTISASYADTTNAQNAVNFGPVGGSGTLTVSTANTATNLNAKNFISTFNETSSQQVILTANVTSTDGGQVTEGTVTFTAGGLTALGSVVNGQASATMTIPAAFAAGSYVVNASYADAANINGALDFGTSSAASGSLTVNSATTQTSVAGASGAFSLTTQQVQLQANVTNPDGGVVTEGTVTFTLNGLTATGNVHNGAASAVLILPAGEPAGRYAITATYADPTNLNNAVNFGGSGGSNSLTVGPTATATVLDPGSLSTAFSTSLGQGVTLTADVASAGLPIAEGTVTFVIGSLPSVSAAVNAKGIATATLNLPAGFAAGSYAVSASFADSLNTNSSRDYNASTGSGTLTVTPAATMVSLNSASATFTSAAQLVQLQADVSSPSGGIVNEGTVTFAVAGQTTNAAVHGGVATTVMSLPAGLAAGSYTVTAGYTDTTNNNNTVNFTPNSGAATLSVGPAVTQVSVGGVTVASSSGAQSLTLSAAVTSPGGSGVDEGAVTFTVAGQTLGAQVHGSLAQAVLTLPAGFAAGQYAIGASYSDSTNANGLVNLSPSTAAPGTLTVLKTTTVTITKVHMTPGFFTVMESVTAQVTSPSGPVDGGIVTFDIGGTQVQASVNNGTATATAMVGASAHGVSASYTNSGALFAGSVTSVPVFLNVFNELLSGMVILESDGSEMVTLDFFGIPLVFMYNSSGGLTGILFGSFSLLI